VPTSFFAADVVSGSGVLVIGDPSMRNAESGAEAPPPGCSTKTTRRKRPRNAMTPKKPATRSNLRRCVARFASSSLSSSMRPARTYSCTCGVFSCSKIFCRNSRHCANCSAAVPVSLTVSFSNATTRGARSISMDCPSSSRASR